MILSAGEWGGSGGVLGPQKRNNSLILGVDLDAIMLASQPSFAAGVLLPSRVLLELRDTWSAKCGVPTRIFFAHIPPP